jgi:hypothetical protein
MGDDRTGWAPGKPNPHRGHVDGARANYSDISLIADVGMTVTPPTQRLTTASQWNLDRLALVN